MWRSRKRFVLFSIIFVMVSFSLLAFPGRWTRSEEVEEAEVLEILTELPAVEEPEVIEEPVEEEVLPVVVPVVEDIENSQDSISMQLLQMLTDYETESKLNKKELETLIGKLEAIRDEYEIICSEMDAKELEINELSFLNAEQADDLAYIRGCLDRETGVKAMADVGFVLGFKEHKPTWGFSSSLGLRFGKGLIMKLGGQYMVGTFTAKPLLNFALDNLSISASVGWEW